MPLREFTVAEVAARMRAARARHRKTCVLIGAGASRSAGIGLASDIVSLISRDYKADYERAIRMSGVLTPSYSQCMFELSENDRSDIVRDYIDRSHINWAHLSIAALERDGYIDRILTTNFDPLASRACSLLNRFPAIYDLASLRDNKGNIQFRAHSIQGSAIYHLHGQHTGFLLLNTDDKLAIQAGRVAPIIKEAMTNRLVIVCGYSGENDPLVEKIAEADFSNSLVWVLHNDRDPSDFVKSRLLERNDDCVIVRNRPADSFFSDLNRELEVKPPQILYNPAEFFLEVLDGVCPFPTGSDGVDLLGLAKDQLRRAITETSIAKTSLLFAEGKYGDIIRDYRSTGGNMPRRPEEITLIAWSAKRQADNLASTNDLPRAVLDSATDMEPIDLYKIALSLEPTLWQAELNMATVIVTESAKSDPIAELEALEFAETHIRNVLLKEPNSYRAYYNLGWIEAKRAKKSTGDAQVNHLLKAKAAYEMSASGAEEDIEVLVNYGLVLNELARLEQDSTVRDLLCVDAERQFERAAELSPRDSRIRNFCAGPLVLRALAEIDEAVADQLFEVAYKKYADALSIDRRCDVAAHNWGTALTNHAQLRSGSPAALLYRLSAERFRQAIALNPDRTDSCTGWAQALIGEASTLSRAKARPLLDQAKEKLLMAEALSPGAGSYDLACLAARRRNSLEAVRWLNNGFDFGTVTSKTEIAGDRDFDRIRKDPEFCEVLARLI